MTAVTDGPTRGAFEPADGTRWRASPARAFLLRALVFTSPILGAFVVLLLVADLLIRPPGLVGLLAWFVQSLAVGSAVSLTIERLARSLLPLATLYDLSLVFPDQAPSRFGVALRAGTVRRLVHQPGQADASMLGHEPTAAATNAVELVAALGRHDRLTRGHTERVRAYAELIATELGLAPGDRAKLAWGVMLHDIGKITVPPEVLNKADELTDEEWAALKRHPEAGARILTPLRSWLGPWALAAGEHHERWDGNGYPRGLAGRQISLAGRITAVADAYDVITSKRSYKEPMTPTAARRELVECSGNQFDPEIVRAMLNVSLGRRWSAGFVAAVSNLPIGNLGTAPAAVTISAVATAMSVAAGVGPAQPEAGRLFDEVVAIETEGSTTPAEPTGSTSTVTSRPPDTAPLESVTVIPETTDPVDASTSTTAPTDTDTTSAGTSATTSVTTPPTTPVTTPPTKPTATSAPTTVTAAPTTTVTTVDPPPTTATATTVSPTTSTTSPPTTTTTTLATTTTTTASATVFHLSNPNSDGQDTTAQGFKLGLVAPPVDTVQYNFDTDRDAIPGLRLEPGSGGWSEPDTRNIQRFFIDTGSATVEGPVTLRLWAATDGSSTAATLRISIAECPEPSPFWPYWDCDHGSITETVATVTQPVSSGFQELVVNLGDPGQAFGSDQNLVVRIIAEGTETVHTAFDSTIHPSSLTMTLS